MDDYILHNIPTLLTRNKSKQWQEDVIESSKSLLLFLKKNKLLIDIEPFDELGELKKDTVIKKSNVTKEGLELFKTTINGWYNYLGKSNAINKFNNISRLEEGLKKIRAANK